MVSRLLNIAGIDLRRHRLSLLAVLVLAGSLGMAGIGASLCFSGLTELRQGIVAINKVSATTADARAVVDQIVQSLVNFTAITLDDLTTEERTKVLAETDVDFRRLEESIRRVESRSADLLSGDQQQVLRRAVESIAHNWQEIRDYDATGMSSAEKAYHFLTIFDSVRSARDVLKTVEIDANRATGRETLTAFARIAENVTLVVYIIVAGATIATLGLASVLYVAARVRDINRELNDANRTLQDHEREIEGGLEALRRAKEAAEAASMAKSQFLATMSHELRTPLNAILGFSDIMMRGVPVPVGHPRHLEYLRDIHTSGEHLLELINDILDFSKVEAGKLELADDVLHLDETVRAAALLLRATAAEAGLALRVDCPERLPPIRGDERRIRQVMLNLVSNALKFTPSGGSVTVEIFVDGQGGLGVAVRDTGIGIAPEHIPLVLEPFAQVDSALSRRHDGTGLGLPLVKAIMELHGGTLRLESVVGFGTTATIVFPAARSIADESAHPEAVIAGADLRLAG